MTKPIFIRKSDCIHYYNCLTKRSTSCKLMKCEESNTCQRYIKKELDIVDYEINNDTFTPAIAHHSMEN